MPNTAVMNNKIKKVGIIGCGYMGDFIARRIQDWPQLEVAALADQREAAAARLSEAVRGKPWVMPAISLINQVDIVIETAHKSAVAGILSEVLDRGKDLLLMSVGGLLDVDEAVWERVFRHKGRIHVPSGALAGLDALRAARLGILTWVTLTTRKPPAGLQGAPYILKQQIQLDNLSQPLQVFEGSARQAVAAFPQNINIAAAVSLAGLGPDGTQVSIWADPHIKTNIHQLDFGGDFGRITVTCENQPSLDNPRTSYLAALSLLATLERYLSPFQLGS